MSNNKQKKRRVWPWILILLILIALGLGWHFGLFGKGGGSGNGDSQQSGGPAAETKAAQPADDETGKTDGEAEREITIEVAGDKILLVEHEITLDELKEEVAKYTKDDTVTLIDNNAVKAVYEDVLKTLEATEVELKTQDK